LKFIFQVIIVLIFVRVSNYWRLVSANEQVKEEQEGIYGFDDAKCKVGTMDIKLDKDFKVILISRY